MRKLFLIPFYFVLVVIAIWGSFYLYNKNELSNYYHAEIKMSYRQVLECFKYKDGKEAVYRSDKFFNEIEKIENQMYQDGYSRAKIKKISDRAWDTAGKELIKELAEK